jgi:hypothetical protein
MTFKRWLTCGLGAVALASLVVAFLPRKTGVLYGFDSPGGRYRVVVLSKSSLLPRPAMPGQAGDGDGIVQLTDRQGNVLRKIDVDAPVNRVGPVTWHPDKVEIKPIADWPLDPPDTEPVK